MKDGRGDPLGRRAAEVLRQDVADERGLEAVLAAVRAEARRDATESQQRRNETGDETSDLYGDAPLPRVMSSNGRPRRTLLLTPLAALAAAGLIFAIGIGTGALLLRRAGPSSLAAADSAAPSPSGRLVEFVFVAPGATRVSLVGEFNGWDAAATPMRAASGRGTWSVSVPLSEGRHVYAFVVDDSTWVTDPQAPLSPEKWYGERNSVVVVPGGPRT